MPDGPERRGQAAQQGGMSFRLLGNFDAQVNGQELRLRGRKTQALLAVLAMAGQAGELRARVAGLLWSESDEDRARGTLRQSLFELRGALSELGGAEAFAAERDTLRLYPVETDLRAVQDALAEDRIHPLLIERTALAQSLLEGFEDIDPAIRTWLLGLRRGLTRQWSRALEALMQRTDLTASHRLEAAQALLRLDATHEAACREVMRAAHAGGDTAGALRAYETLWDALALEHDMEPSAQTQALVAEIKAGTAPAPAPVAKERTPVRLAILVPPFMALGVSQERSHLVDGFRHELIACLTRFREWFVVDGPVLPQITSEMVRVGTQMTLEVRAEEAGGQLGLVLLLRDEASRVMVWSDRYTLTLEDWFETRRKIVSNIAVSLLGSIATARLAETNTIPDVSLAAHDKWLRGQKIINMFRPEDWRRAEALFTEAIGEAPAYSPPYSSLAQMDNAVHIAHPGLRRTRAREIQAIQRAEQAVLLDPVDSRAHLCLGWSLSMAKRYDRASTHMNEAVKLNPLDPWTLMAAALFNAYGGEHDNAAELAKESLKLSAAPNAAHWVYQSAIAYLRGDDVLAAEAAGRTLNAALPSRAWHAAALFNLGREEEAREIARGFLAAARMQWYGTEEPTDEAIGSWFLHLFPIAKERDWSRLRQGIAGAGIPSAGARHHGW
ncbi:hypothetical protein EOD42_21145 [Rhodovarius crocodyli]|uniref:Bacterial transcriptional activator domain-containing protein n=2 Tax=Rhodovarius crocodyli TaxID=1979269 RepID=A0A437M2R3_9PROT|nr:hypothetical protein EOD42_21145 [Rhodovarius crocodyli]